YQSRHRSQGQPGVNPDMAQMDQKITGPAKPGKKSGRRHGVEEGKMSALDSALGAVGMSMPMSMSRSMSAMGRSMSSAMGGSVAVSAEMQMLGQMHMRMEGAAEKRDHAKGKAHDETDQVKQFPVHLSLTQAVAICALVRLR